MSEQQAEKIVWMVHPRSMKELKKNIPKLRFLPDFFVYFLLNFIRPRTFSTFKSENPKIDGKVIGIPLLPIYFQKNLPVVNKDISYALKLSKEFGAKTISVGGFLASAIDNIDQEEKKNLMIFDGTNLLARMAVKKIEELVGGTNKRGVVIVGATTKIGSILSKLLSQSNSIDSLCLIGRNKEKLKNLEDGCSNTNIKITSSVDLSDVKDYNFLIMTSYISENYQGLIDNIKPDSTLWALIEPVSPFFFELKQNRGDINFIKGITINTPGINYPDLNMGLAPDNSFACITEAIISVDRDEIENLKSLDKNNSVYSMDKLFKKYNFNFK